MREILSLHSGQAGVQMGNAIWELLCLEHSISEDGSYFKECEVSNTNVFFQETMEDRNVPRSLFLDLEPSVIDEIRHGSYRTLFHPERLITGPEDSASNFARGFFTVGKLVLASAETQIRKMFECSSHVQAMLIYRSLSGGTGAGLTSAVFESLSEYPKTTKIELSVYPSPSVTSSTVEPYNCLLGEHFSMDDIGLGILVDNESLYDIAYRDLCSLQPTFTGINRIISQVVSSITASSRFQSVAGCDVTLMLSNLVPFPRIHHPLCNISPLLATKTSSFEDISVKDITQTLFMRENQLLKVDPFLGKYMSCVLCYRGNINICNVYEALSDVKRNRTVQFVDWCPTGFKVGISLTPPITVPGGGISDTDKNVMMLTNTSAVSQALQRTTNKFFMLYSRRAFVHWFVAEGIEECEFTESLYNIGSLVKDYEEISMPSDSVPEMAPPQKKVSMPMKPEELVEGEHHDPDLFVTMANGIAVSAPDRSSLANKSSLLKSGYFKNSVAADIANTLKNLDGEAAKSLMKSVKEVPKEDSLEEVHDHLKDTSIGSKHLISDNEFANKDIPDFKHDVIHSDEGEPWHDHEGDDPLG